MLKANPNNEPVRQLPCIREDPQGESLTVGKVYSVIYDSKAESHGYVRVVDDSGEDFLYSNKFFVLAELPPVTEPNRC